MTSLKKQQGMALLIAMMILPMLILMGFVSISGSFIDLKMIDARISHHESRINLDSTATHIIATPNIASSLAQATDGTVFSSAVFTGSAATAKVLGESTCKRRKNASGDNFQCKYINLELSERYGRTNSSGQKWGKNKLSVGVEQRFFGD